jgi:hypothetical protein
MGLEGILDVTHAGRALAEEDPYDVEAHGVEGWLSIEEVEFGEGADPGLFAWVTASRGSPKPVPRRSFTSTNTRVVPWRTTRSSSP